MRIDHMHPLRIQRFDLIVAFPYPLMKCRALLIETILRPASFHPFHRFLQADIQKQRQIRQQPLRRKQVHRIDLFHADLTAIALIGKRTVDKAITDHMRAVFQCR